jgi:hypothetical protein
VTTPVVSVDHAHVVIVVVVVVFVVLFRVVVFGRV